MFLAFSPTVELADAEEKLHGLMDGTMEDATGFAFEVYDTNKDGYVDADEFASVLQATVKQKERRQSSIPKEIGALKAAATGAGADSAAGGDDDDEDGWACWESFWSTTAVAKFRIDSQPPFKTTLVLTHVYAQHCPGSTMETTW